MADIQKDATEEALLRIKPQGNSMYPFICSGRNEVLVERYVPGMDIKRGDVILYRRKESILVLHRVYRIHGDRIWFIGDNQTEAEGPLPVSCIKGRVTAIIRNNASGQKVIPVSNPCYRISASLWLCARPLRVFIRKLKSIRQ